MAVMFERLRVWLKQSYLFTSVWFWIVAYRFVAFVSHVQSTAQNVSFQRPLDVRNCAVSGVIWYILRVIPFKGLATLENQKETGSKGYQL